MPDIKTLKKNGKFQPAPFFNDADGKGKKW